MADNGLTVPEFAKWINPLICALSDLGGSGKPREVVERVAETENVPDQVLDVQNQSGGQRFANQVHWARYFLAEGGFIDRSRRGVWALTDKGRSVKQLTPLEIRNLVTGVHARSRSSDQVSTPVLPRVTETERPKSDSEIVVASPEDEATPEAEYGDYAVRLMRILRSLSPSGFERLCQRVLREAGFEQVVVTGRSNDGGIDGHGILSLNAFVSFRVLFQCKRYAGSVSPAQVRDFRGAMQGRADKGIIITTGTFTAEAKREASRDGAPPVELVDGEKLIELFAKLELGLEPVTTYEVNERFFEEYR